MKKLGILLLVAISLFLTSCDCKGDYPDATYTITMQKITGDWVTARYTFKDGTTFSIRSDRGSYDLYYTTPGNGWVPGCISYGVVKYAVTDFEITNIKK